MQKSMYRAKIETEQRLRAHIKEVLQADALSTIARVSGLDESVFFGRHSDDSLRSSLLGGGLMVTETSAPQLCAMMNEVKGRLEIARPIDLFVVSDATPNAFSIAAKEWERGYVILTSGLVALLTDSELRFVLGHELGHIENQDFEIERLVDYIFPRGTGLPLVFRHRLRLWRQMCELSADRYGYEGCGDLAESVVALSTVASGVAMGRLHRTPEEMLAHYRQQLDHGRGLANFSTHPGIPLRVEALDRYAHAGDEEELAVGTAEVTDCILEMGNSEEDRQVEIFLATAGLMIGQADGTLSEGERHAILDHLAIFDIFPSVLLDKVVASDIEQLFSHASAYLVRHVPTLRDALMEYIIHIALVDGQIRPAEVETVFRLGERYLDFSRETIARHYADTIRRTFLPQTDSMYKTI